MSASSALDFGLQDFETSVQNGSCTIVLSIIVTVNVLEMENVSATMHLQGDTVLSN